MLRPGYSDGMLFLLLACSKPTDTGCPQVENGTQVGSFDAACACEEPSLMVGTTVIEDLGGTPVLAYAPVSDGQIPMVHGVQGGWHVTAGMWLTGTRSIVTLQTRVMFGSTEVSPWSEAYVQLVDEEGCAGSFPGLTLYLFTEEALGDIVPKVLACQDVVVEICAQDSGGRDLCSTETWTLLPDPVDVEDGIVEDCE
ncbi:MAG: hypothetical protein ACI9VR_000695 [Cognaticolwellia sp.]